MSKTLQPAGPDVKTLMELTDVLKDLHHKVYEHLTLIDERMKSGQTGIQDMVDLGFLCREQEDLLDEMRKNAKARREFTQRLLVTKWTGAAMTADPLPDTIRATLASANNFRIKKMAQLPEYGGKDYVLYMESLGIPKEVIQKGLVKPDWEQTAEHVTVLLEDGKKLPPGIGQTWNIYTCTFIRTRRKVQTEQED